MGAFDYASKYFNSFKIFDELPTEFTKKQYDEIKRNQRFHHFPFAMSISALRDHGFVKKTREEQFTMTLDKPGHYYYYKGVKISEESYKALYNNATPKERKKHFKDVEDKEEIAAVKYYYTVNHAEIERYKKEYAIWKDNQKHYEEQINEIDKRIDALKKKRSKLGRQSNYPWSMFER